MGGHIETIAVILSINVVLAYAAFLPLTTGQVNLGIAGFMAIGAYAAAWCSGALGLPALAAIGLGATVTGLVAFCVSFPVLRTRAIYLALATLALGECIRGGLMNIAAMGGAAGYPVTAYVGGGPIVLTALAAFAAVFYLYHTRFGICLVAIETDERVADLLGVNTRMLKVAAFSIGGALAGLAGGLYAHHFSFVEAQHFTVLLSVSVVMYVLLGGARSIWGPLAGAAFFTLLPEVLRDAKEWRYALFAVLVIAAMALRPEGVFTGRRWSVGRGAGRERQRPKAAAGMLAGSDT